MLTAGFIADVRNPKSKWDAKWGDPSDCLLYRVGPEDSWKAMNNGRALIDINTIARGQIELAVDKSKLYAKISKWGKFTKGGWNGLKSAFAVTVSTKTYSVINKEEE